MADNIRPAGTFDTSYNEDMALNRTRGSFLRTYGSTILLLFVPLLVTLPIIGDIFGPVWVTIINTIAIFVIAAQGLNILIGYAGQISLGHAAFMAVGAYSGALLARGFSVGDLVIPALPFWLVIPLAALFTGLVGLIFGLPSLRVKGFYLAMATLAAQFIIPWLIENPLKPWTNAPDALQNIPPPSIFGYELATASQIYYLIIPLSILLMLLARNVMRTRTGRAFISVRDNDLAAELLGINIFTYKLQAFFLSALYAGIAGCLMAYERNTLSPDFFSLEVSIELLAMLVIGGAGFPKGPLFGVAFVKLMTSAVIPALGPVFNSILPPLLPFIDPVSIGTSLKP
ncbi:MAG: branched-chain amino acid ABC transporter permease, partial [Anaerolineae bacterium]|nr:branched-chain amino acid ABC transporter permease [Anaerolineae bacterium]